MGETTAAVKPRYDYRLWPATRAMLLANPAWVQEDAELLAALNLRPAAANLIEFGPAALSRLERSLAHEAGARAEVEALAEANYAAQSQTHAAIVDLLEARHNADLAARVDEAARARFGLTAGALVCEGLAPAGWKSVAPGFVETIVGPGAARFGAPIAAEPVFGDRAEEVASIAFIRMSLWADETPGLLAFGSPDPQGFAPEMGAELVAFLARVVERTAERWPPLR